jgi:hypothetical protein
MSSWIEKPSNLVAKLNLLPEVGDTFGEKLNALTRLLVVIVIVLVLLKWKYWNIILIVGIFLIIFFYLLKSEPDKVEHFNENLDDPKHYDMSSKEKNCPCQKKAQIVSPPVTYIPPSEPTPQVNQDSPYSNVSWEQLCTYVKCEQETISVPQPVEEKIVPQAPVSRIRRPKTGVVIRSRDDGKERTAYDHIQESYDFARKHAPKPIDYSNIAGIL